MSWGAYNMKQLHLNLKVYPNITQPIVHNIIAQNKISQFQLQTQFHNSKYRYSNISLRATYLCAVVKTSGWSLMFHFTLCYASCGYSCQVVVHTFLGDGVLGKKEKRSACINVIFGLHWFHYGFKVGL